MGCLCPTLREEPLARLMSNQALSAHRNPQRQAGAKLPGLCLPRRCSCMVDLMSLDPNTGGGTFHYNCTLPTWEMCVQEVIAGNRGFCSPNPYYRGPEIVRPRAKRRRY